MSISGEQTKVARELFGWTEAQMALEAGATVTEINDFGTGKKRPAKLSQARNSAAAAPSATIAKRI
jgi:hypothetical protein